MKAIISNNISITLAQIMGDAILSHNSGTVEQRHLDALSVNKKAYDVIVANRKEILKAGSFEAATQVAKNLIK